MHIATVRSQIELARRDKDERVGRDERKPMMPDFKGQGQTVSSEVKQHFMISIWLSEISFEGREIEQ